jgi:hypothetical protein
MKIDLVFTLSAGIPYRNQTSDYATLDDCKKQIVNLMGCDVGSLTLNEPDGGKTILAARHVVSVRLTPAGDQ